METDSTVFAGFLPAITMELPQWGVGNTPPTVAMQYQIQFFFITAVWLVLLKKARMDIWMFAQLCQAFNR